MKNRLTMFIMALLLTLASCAMPGGTNVPATPAPPPGEAELRERLAGLQNDSQAALECYAELEARDALTEADRQARAALYAQGGDTQRQRQELYALLILYPSDDYAQQLSDLLAERDAQGPCGDLAAQAAALLAGGDGPGMRALVSSEAWNAAFQDGLRAVEIRSRCQTPDGLLQVRAGVGVQELTWFTQDGALYYYHSDSSGSVLASAVYADGGYNGAFTSDYWDAGDAGLISYSGTMAQNVCTGELRVTYKGVTYKGKLNDDGTTAEKQETTVSRKGGVVYARSGSSYLYKENTSKEEFRADCALIGLPLYEVWE